MNDYICVGKIVNTFGIKGELKVISDFEYKDRVFIKGFNIYVGEYKYKEVIESHRVHKNNDLILFTGYTDINEVLKYKGYNIYIDKNDLKLNDGEYLLNDLIGFNVYDNGDYLGEVILYERNVSNILLKVKGDKEFYIPYINEYIKEIDIDNKKIMTNNGRSLII